MLYMNQNMQVLFAIFVAEIVNNFVGKSIAFTDYIIFFEIFFVFRHALVEKLKQRINSSLLRPLLFISLTYTKTKITNNNIITIVATRLHELILRKGEHKMGYKKIFYSC